MFDKANIVYRSSSVATLFVASHFDLLFCLLLKTDFCHHLYLEHKLLMNQKKCYLCIIGAGMFVQKAIGAVSHEEKIPETNSV